MNLRMVFAVGLMLVSMTPHQASLASDRALLELHRQYEQQLQRDREQFEASQEELRRRGDEQVRRIEQLRVEIDRCGACSRREGLQAEHDALVAQRQLGLDLGCAALQAMGVLNRGLGSAPICRGVEANREDDRLRRLHAAAEGGGSEALFALGMAYRSRDRFDEACKYFRALAQRDYDPGIVYFNGCLWQKLEPGDPALVLAKLPGCAARKVAECQFALGRAMTAFEHPKIARRQVSLPLDEPRALQLWEEAAMATKWRLYYEMVEALRQHMGLGPSALPALPTMQAERPRAVPVSAFATSSFMATGRDSHRRPYRLTVSIQVQSDGSYRVHRGAFEVGRGVLEGTTLTVDFGGVVIPFDLMADGSLVGQPPRSSTPEVWKPQGRAMRRP